MRLTDNLDDAIDLSQQIEKLLVAKRELKAGIWQTELGNFQHEFEHHPLYAEINARIAELRVAITELA